MIPEVISNIREVATNVRELPSEIVDGLDQLIAESEISILTYYRTGHFHSESYYNPWNNGINGFSLKELSNELDPLLNDADKKKLWSIIRRVRELEERDPSIRKIIEQYYTDLIESEITKNTNSRKGYFSDFRFESRAYDITTIKATYIEKRYAPYNSRIAKAIKGTYYESRWRKPRIVKHEASLYVLWWGPRRFVSYSWFSKLGTVESVTPPWEWFNLGRLGFSLGKAITKSIVNQALKRVSNIRIARALSRQLKSNPKALSKRQSNRGVDTRAIERNTYRVKSGDRGTLPKPARSPASLSKELDDIGTELKAVKEAKRKAWAKRREAKASSKSRYRDPNKQDLVSRHHKLIEREKELLQRQRALSKRLKNSKGIEPRSSWLVREREAEKVFRSKIGNNNVYVKPKVAVIGKNKGHIPSHLIRNNKISVRNRRRAGLRDQEVTPELLVKVNAKRYVMIDAKGETLLGRHAQNLVYRQMQKDGKAIVVHAGKDGAKVGAVVQGQVLKVGPKQLARLQAAKTRTELIRLIDDLLKEQKSLYR